MSTDYPIFYETLAVGMNDMLVSINLDLDCIVKSMELLEYLIDVTTDVDFDAAQAVSIINPVMKYHVYSALITLPQFPTNVHHGVEVVNNYTKRYINADLTDFVNNEVWAGDCVPYEWAVASEITGEDISGWNVCDPS